MKALRLMVYDRTCTGRDGRAPLSYAWRAGGSLYGALGRLDAWRGVASWREAFTWLAEVHPGRRIEQVQYWGHGLRGRVFVGKDCLDADVLRAQHPLGASMRRVRERMVGGDAGLWWFRTCLTFGGAEGHAFASAWSDCFDTPTAGHTHEIGFWQSGLYLLRPGATPTWSRDEGFTPRKEGQEARPLGSGPRLARTIHCLRNVVPE